MDLKSLSSAPCGLHSNIHADFLHFFEFDGWDGKVAEN